MGADTQKRKEDAKMKCEKKRVGGAGTYRIYMYDVYRSCTLPKIWCAKTSNVEIANT
jgi:hypothetical protein